MSSRRRMSSKAPASPTGMLNDDAAERKQLAEKKAKVRRQSGASASSSGTGTGQPRSRLSVGGNGSAVSGGGRSTKITFNSVNSAQLQSGMGSQADTVYAGNSSTVGGRLDAAIGLALTNEQLTDMYANIIRLSAENKINAKNAFDLDLINNARDVIAAQTGQNAGGHAGTTNFQAASHTLDAAIQIYCARMDVVHTVTSNFRGGLHTANALDDGSDDYGLDGDGGADRGDDDDDDDDESKKAPKRRVRAAGSTLANPTAITTKEVEAGFEPDPLFKQMQKVFDGSGAGGLLLNHLTVRRGCELVFDSRDRVGPARKSRLRGKRQENSENSNTDVPETEKLDNHVRLCPHDDHEPIDMLRVLRDAHFGRSVLQLEICPEYSGYEAGAVAKMANLRRVIESRGGASVDMSTNMSVAKTPAKKGKRSVSTGGGNMLAPYSDDDSDCDADRTDEHIHGGASLPSLTNLVGAIGDSESPLADDGERAAADVGSHFGDFDMDDMGDAGDMGGDFDDSDAEDLYGGEHEGGGLLDDVEFAAAMNAEQTMLDDVDDFADISTEVHPIQDAADITDVFNVDTAMLTAGSNWAGLSHWKFKQPRRSARTTADSAADVAGNSAAGAGASAKTRKRKEPFFIDFSAAGAVDEETLFAPAGRKATTLSDAALKKLEADAALNTELPPDVHYDAKMLTQLFLKPQWRVALRGGGLVSAPAKNADHGAGRGGHDGFDSDDDVGLGDDGAYDFGFGDDFDDDTAQETGHGGRLQLVARPKTVGDVGINYAKHAKMVDVKALKESMWHSLADALPTQRKPEPEDSSDEDEDMEDEPYEETTFQDIITELPKTVPEQMMNELSVSYCFICLLHLANEQQLEINDTPELNELHIKRGRPSSVANE